MLRCDDKGVSDSAFAAAARRLAQQYPGVGGMEVRALLQAASVTVFRLVGREDIDLACDLAQLRLDVRTRGVSGAAPR